MKHTVKGWLAMSVPEPGEKSFVAFVGYKPSGEYFVPIREHSIEVDVPDDFDPRPAAAAAIDEQIATVRAELTEKVTELQGRKSRLLAITMETAE